MSIKRYTLILMFICSVMLLPSCRDDFSLQSEESDMREVEIEVRVGDYSGTRFIDDESKRFFEVGELLHIRAEYDCSRRGDPYKYVEYGVLKYNGKGKWVAFDNEHSLKWPNDAVSGSFTAYYICGSNGILTSNTMEAKLLSDFKYGEDPLCGKAPDVRYGETIRLEMFHIFSHLTLSEMNSEVTEELWFAVPEPLEGEPVLNNAFYLDFNEETKEITPVFTQRPSLTYKDKKGNQLVYIKGETELYETEEGEMLTRVSYFLEPRAYHKFSLLYPRSRTQQVTYLSYTRDLQQIVGPEGFIANGRYDFSVLKSLGVVVNETPGDTWDESDPVYIVDVEEFLKAANSGSDYWEDIEDSDEKIQILEQSPDGSRLLVNIDFHYFYYYPFEDGYIPNLSNTFDGDFHYIYHLACPLFYDNNGNIMNLGLRDIKTPEIESNENYGATAFDTSYNGLISCRNFGTVKNIRMVNAEMNVGIRTSDPDEPTQEAHNSGLLFGVNRGNVYNIGFSGSLVLNVGNAAGETTMPNVLIGGLAGQNLGLISGVSAVEAQDFASPEIRIKNRCKGENGVYLAGGVTGINTGILDDIYLPSVEVDCSPSSGVESRLGGIVGEIPNSNSGSPQISACIVRGKISAGSVKSLTNVSSMSYAGGVAGSMNIQGIVVNTSVSMSVEGTSNYDAAVVYATGGAFGRIEQTEGSREGDVRKLAAFGSLLTGLVNVGNFAGIAPVDFDWDHYADSDINVRQAVEKNIGAIM